MKTFVTNFLDFIKNLRKRSKIFETNVHLWLDNSIRIFASMNILVATHISCKYLIENNVY